MSIPPVRTFSLDSGYLMSTSESRTKLLGKAISEMKEVSTGLDLDYSVSHGNVELGDRLKFRRALMLSGSRNHFFLFTLRDELRLAGSCLDSESWSLADSNIAE